MGHVEAQEYVRVEERGSSKDSSKSPSDESDESGGLHGLFFRKLVKIPRREGHRHIGAAVKEMREFIELTELPFCERRISPRADLRRVLLEFLLKISFEEDPEQEMIRWLV